MQKLKKLKVKKTAAILRAQGRAEEIRLVQEQLTRSPNYIELVKWKGYADGKGSPYGQDNVFGAGTSLLLKDLNKLMNSFLKVKNLKAFIKLLSPDLQFT